MSYKDGLCFPSYETIAERARCCRDTVYEAIIALEATGIFSWVNRIDRVAERGKDRRELAQMAIGSQRKPRSVRCSAQAATRKGGG
jgi:hypothetical protein